MNTKEAKDWLEEFSVHSVQFGDNKKIILCPPFPLLPICGEYIHKHNLPIILGAQNVSSFDEGAYTGEVSARLLKDWCQYVLIGHSERRKYFHESEEDVKEKVSRARAYQLTPLLLMSDPQQKVPQGVDIVIYEPPSAISSSKNPTPPTPEEVEAAVGLLQAKNTVAYILYGGSVDSRDVATYTHVKGINGVIVGQESLNPQTFIDIISHA